MHINVTTCPLIRVHYYLAWTSRCVLHCYKWVRNCRQHSCLLILLFFLRRNNPCRSGPSYRGFAMTLKTHHTSYHSSGPAISLTQRPLPETTHHSHETYMPLAGFEPAIAASERPQTHAFDCVATGNASIAVRPYKRHG